jgi:integrase
LTVSATEEAARRTIDKSLAEKIASTIKSDILRQKHDLPTVVNYNQHNFQDLFEQYLEAQTVSPLTKKRKIIASKNFLPVFINKNIQHITKDQIENYQLKRKLEILSLPKNKEKREQEISFRTVNIELEVLRNFFNFCIEKGYINTNINPAIGIKKLNELSRLKILSDSDIDKLIVGATNKLTRDLITFQIYTGCRKSETLNLKWDDVDLQNNVIGIKGTKTKYDRYIPISNALNPISRCLYVFQRNGAKLGDFKGSFHTACRNAGIKDLHIHDLRHVFASKMVMGGTSLYILGELLGHRTTLMTKRYSHLVPETLKKAVDDVWGRK